MEILKFVSVDIDFLEIYSEDLSNEYCNFIQKWLKFLVSLIFMARI